MLNANGPGWLHCKLMRDLGRRGLGARTVSRSQLETGAAPGEPNKINIPVNFSLFTQRPATASQRAVVTVGNMLGAGRGALQGHRAQRCQHRDWSLDGHLQPC